MEIDVFLALKSAGIPDTEARAAAAAIREDVSAEVHEATKEMATTSDLKEMATKSDLKEMATKIDLKEMATKSDLALLKAEFKMDMANLKTELSAQIVGIHRSTVTTMFGGLGMMAAVMALLHFLR
jgi:hypothetical protein